MSAFRQHIRATLSLGLPLVGGMLGQTAISLTDTVMMGWYGVSELAAVAIAASYFHVIMIVGMGFGLAVTPMVAAAVANADGTQVRRTTRMGLWIAIQFSLICMPLFWWSGPIFVGFGQTAQISADAETYLRIAGWAIGPTLIMVVLRSHLSALERARVVLWATLAGAFLNAGLNWLLIFGNLGFPELGIRGAAIASVATQALICVLLVLFATRARGLSDYALLTRFWRPDWEAYGAVFRLGWPIALTLLSETGLFMATMIMMGWIGEHELAAHGIAIQIASTTFMVHIGLSQAATVRAGRAWGTRDTGSLRIAAAAALLLSGIMVALTVLAFVGMPEVLIGLFVDPGDPLRPTIIALGSSLLLVAALFQLADAAQVMALGLLRGVQDTKVPMIYAIISYWGIGVPCAYLFGFTLGLDGPGIWLGLVVGLALAGLAMMLRFWRGFARLPAASGPPAQV